MVLPRLKIEPDFLESVGRREKSKEREGGMNFEDMMEDLGAVGIYRYRCRHSGSLQGWPDQYGSSEPKSQRQQQQESKKARERYLRSDKRSGRQRIPQTQERKTCVAEVGSKHATYNCEERVNEVLCTELESRISGYAAGSGMEVLAKISAGGPTECGRPGMRNAGGPSAVAPGRDQDDH